MTLHYSTVGTDLSIPYCRLRLFPIKKKCFLKPADGYLRQHHQRKCPSGVALGSLWGYIRGRTHHTLSFHAPVCSGGREKWEHPTKLKTDALRLGWRRSWLCWVGVWQVPSVCPMCPRGVGWEPSQEPAPLRSGCVMELTTPSQRTPDLCQQTCFHFIKCLVPTSPSHQWNSVR